MNIFDILIYLFFLLYLYSFFILVWALRITMYIVKFSAYLQTKFYDLEWNTDTSPMYILLLSELCYSCFTYYIYIYIENPWEFLLSIKPIFKN